MSTTLERIYTSEQLTDAARQYQGFGRDRAVTEQFLNVVRKWPKELASATLDEIERQLNAAAATPSLPAQATSVPQAAPVPPSRFRDIAQRALARGECRILPIKIGGKNPAIKWVASEKNIAEGVDTRIDTFDTEAWAEVANQWVEELAAKFPDLNACVIAKPDEHVFIDCDTTQEFVTAYEAFAGEKFPVTYTTSARENRTQIHFQQTDATRALGNIQQFAVNGIDLSVRQRNEYVIAEGSIHMKTGTFYVAIINAPIAVMPDKLVTFVKHLIALNDAENKKNAKSPTDTVPRNERELVSHGNIHGYLLSEAGRLRNLGLGEESIRVGLRELVEKNCEPPIDWDKVDTMAKSICNFPAGENTTVILNQQPSQSVQTATQPQAIPPAVAPVPVVSQNAYPKFPDHVMFGTSIYEDWVKPYCEKNSRIPFFMWLPCASMVLNYLGGKVSIPFKGWKPSMYLFLIGRKGRVKKSSSIKDAMAFLEFAGVLAHYSKGLKNADGKTIVMEGGSAEGIGSDMQRINCKNVVLHWDEMSKLEAKANIQGAAVKDMLLKMYESNSWGNSVKTKKDAFNLNPGEYTASLITSTTTRTFGKLWGRLLDGADGLDSRSTLILEPETLPEMTPQHTVNFQEAALATRKLIDRAVEKQKYEFFDQTPLQRFLKECGDDDRSEIRAEKWALLFAVLLGLDEIDEDCVSRGIDLARYEMAVKKYVMTMESKSELAALQQDIIRKLSYHGGRMKLSALKAAVEAKMYDTYFWWKAYSGLQAAGHIVETPETGKAAGSNGSMVTLIQGFHEEGDDE